MRLPSTLSLLILLGTILSLSVCFPTSSHAADLTEEDIPRLIEALEGGHRQRSFNAIEDLGHIGAPAVPYLIEVLSQPEFSDSSLFIHTCMALGRIGPDAAPALPVLADQVEIREKELLRGRAIDAMRGIGPASVPYLLLFLDSEERFIVSMASGVLSRIEPPAVEAIPALLELLPNDMGGASWALRHMGQTAVPFLIERLRDPDPVVRKGAAKALNNEKTDLSSYIDDIVQALGDEDEKVRSEVQGCLFFRSDEALPYLVESTRSENSRARKEAVILLGQVRSDPDLAGVCIVEAIYDSVQDVRLAAIESFHHLLPNSNENRALPAGTGDFLDAVHHPDPEVRGAISFPLICLFGRDEGVYEAFEILLDDDDPDVRRRAAGTLHFAGKSGSTEKASKLLRKAANDSSDRVSSEAIHSLGRLALPEIETIVLLCKKLEHGTRNERSRALQALGEFGSAARPTVPLLIRTYADGSDDWKDRVVVELGAIGGDPELVFPILREATKDSRHRDHALAAIAKIRPELNQGVLRFLHELDDSVFQIPAMEQYLFGNSDCFPLDVLEEALQSQQSEIRHAAACMLRYLGADAVSSLPSLITALEDEDKRVRDSAIWAIGMVGKPEKERAIRSLLECWPKEENRPGRWSISWALRNLEPSDPELLPFLLESLENEETMISENAAHTIGFIGGPAVPALIERLDYETKNVRQGAAQALADMGGYAAPAVPALTRALGDRSLWVRREAAWALGRIGPASFEAIPALEALLDDPDEQVREAAAWALENLRSPSNITR